jgi:hypothetical protein
MDALFKILQTPLGTILALAGIAIVFFAFFEAGKGIIRMRKSPKDGLVPAAIGAVFIIGGLILSRSQAAAPVEPTSVPVAFTEVSPVVPSVTVAPTDTVVPSETTSPAETQLIPTETASPVPVKTLADGCIAVQTWQADSTDAEALGAILDENNCWNMERLGFTAQSGTLHILPKPPNVQTASGIYTAINNQSIIEFKVFVRSIYLVYEGNPAYISFSIAPQDNPMARQDSGRFKLQIKDNGSSPLVYFMLADTIESNGTELGTQHYLYGRTYNIRLELKGLFMEISINGVKLRETASIPSGPKVFYIGYNLPLLAGADVELRDIIIDGVNQ